MKTGVVNVISWSEIGSEFVELGGTPDQEFPGVLWLPNEYFFYLFILTAKK